MWWEVSADRPQTDPRSLIALAVRTLGGPNGNGMEQVRNVLNYPDSPYDNIRDPSS
jgi:chitinase